LSKRLALAGHEGFVESHGSMSIRTPFGERMRNVEWPSQVTDNRSRAAPGAASEGSCIAVS